MQTVLIAGASGFIGKALIRTLKENNFKIIKLVRDAPKNSEEFFWDYEQKRCDLSSLTPIDIVINLSGENIMGMWGEAKKKRILQSRIDSTRYLSELFVSKFSPPKLYLQASAVGYYGNRGAEILNESSPPGLGFLPTVCEEWENSIHPKIAKDVRCVLMRFGIVLDPTGGALRKMLPAYKCGLGASLGNGEQYVSWITLEDLLSAIHFIILNTTLKGPVNFSAEPVKYKDFSKALAAALQRPEFLKIPDYLIKFSFGEASSLFLDSQRVSALKLKENSFTFKFPTIENAFKHFF